MSRPTLGKKSGVVSPTLYPLLQLADLDLEHEARAKQEKSTTMCIGSGHSNLKVVPRVYVLEGAVRLK